MKYLRNVIDKIFCQGYSNIKCSKNNIGCSNMNNTIPAVKHTIAVLEYISSTDSGVTQSEIRQKLQISMSSAYRILQTLLKHRWVRKDDAGRYELDHGILPLVHHCYRSMQIFEHAQDLMDDITQKLNVACKISLRRGEEQTTIMRSELPGPFSLTGRVGASFPVVEGSVGAALLYHEDNDTILELLSRCTVDIPEKSSPEQLLDSVQEVRENGVVFNLKKNRWNIAAGSIPLHDRERRVVAALTVVGNMEDFSGQKLPLLTRAMRHAAEMCENI